MNATIYFEDGTRQTIHHVDSITWTRQNVYIDVLETWNECPERDETFILSAKRFRKS